MWRLADPIARGNLTHEAADWRAFLAAGLRAGDREPIRARERNGRPPGDSAFVERARKTPGRPLKRQRKTFAYSFPDELG